MISQEKITEITLMRLIAENSDYHYIALSPEIPVKDVLGSLDYMAFIHDAEQYTKTRIAHEDRVAMGGRTLGELINHFVVLAQKRGT